MGYIDTVTQRLIQSDPSIFRVGLVITVSWLLFRSFTTSKHKQAYPYPPGPTAKHWLTGNLRDIPVSRPWLTYAQWKEVFGDVIHFNVLGHHMLILNSFDAVRKRLEQRSGIYSDRPRIPMVDMIGWDFSTGLSPYGDAWRKHRRLERKIFGRHISYRPIQTKKTHEMLYGLATTPDDFQKHYSTLGGAVIVSILYGFDVAPTGDLYVGVAESALRTLSESMVAEANIVNVLPILRYLPSWFPGAEFKRYASDAREILHRMRNMPFNMVKNKLRQGATPSCIVSEYLESHSSNDDDTLIKDVAASLYSAGVDTTSSSIGTFFLAMVQNPEVQAKAQSEIDSVVGQDRLPTFDDREKLPYIEAIVREVLRWRPVANLGLAHSTSEDDFFENQFIPKGTIVWANVWAMSHDPVKYQNPEDFNPDRHIDSKGTFKEDDIYAFGFGRRVCPGRDLAMTTLWLAVASTLAVFDIKHKKDEFGQDIPLTGEYVDALLSHPLPFEASVTLRSEQTQRLVFEAVGKADTI